MTTTYSNFGEQPAYSERPVNVVPVVGLWKRFFAAFIDSLILGLVGCVVGGVFGAGFGVLLAASDSSPQAADTGLSLMSNCIGLLVGAVYHIAFWSATGQTLGKMALGLRVVTETGEKPTIGVATVRYVGFILSGIILYIGFAMAAFDDQKRALHDKIAKTFVVHANHPIPAGQSLNFVPENPSNQSDVLGVALFYGLFCIVPILMIALLTALGPQIGNVFEQIPSTAP
jgi:uncharacterized RDD family membrane protein YckC